MWSGRPSQKPPRCIYASLAFRNSCRRRCRRAGRRGFRLSGRASWGWRSGSVSCGNNAGSSAEVWPCWLSLPLEHVGPVTNTHKAEDLVTDPPCFPTTKNLHKKWKLLGGVNLVQRSSKRRHEYSLSLKRKKKKTSTCQVRIFMRVKLSAGSCWQQSSECLLRTSKMKRVKDDHSPPLPR